MTVATGLQGQAAAQAQQSTRPLGAAASTADAAAAKGAVASGKVQQGVGGKAEGASQQGREPWHGTTNGHEAKPMQKVQKVIN